MTIKSKLELKKTQIRVFLTHMEEEKKTLHEIRICANWLTKFDSCVVCTIVLFELKNNSL